MKSIRMDKDFHFRAGARVWIKFIGGAIYHRVTEAAAQAIIAAGAGRILTSVDLLPSVRFDGADGDV